MTGCHDVPERYLEKIIKNEHDSHNHVRIMIAAIQILYLRDDMSFKRKTILYHSLAKALYSCKEENNMTALAASLLINAESSIMSNIIKNASLYIYGKRHSNIDFFIAIAICLKQTGSALEALGLDKKEIRTLKSAGAIYTEQDDLLSYLSSIFFTVGIKQGFAHRTKLFRTINVAGGELDDLNPFFAKVLISNLHESLEKIKDKYAYIFHHEDHLDEISKAITELKKLADELGGVAATIKEHGPLTPYNLPEIKTLRKAHTYLFESSLVPFRRKAIEWFTKTSVDMVGMIEKVCKRLQSKYEKKKFAIKLDSHFDINKEKPLVLLFTYQINTCLTEHIDNAFKYATKEYSGGKHVKIHIICNNKKSLNIHIKNNADNAPRSQRTQNDSFVEHFHGHISIDDKLEERIVNISLPTLSELIK